ncbi:hypothetical protein QQ045_031112 [Rhodiola kirilowii]
MTDINIGGTIDLTENLCSMEPSFFSKCGVAFWTPKCPDQHKSFIGQKFLSPDDDVKFYENYAQIAGFNVRANTTINSDGVVKMKHLLCHRQDFKRQKMKVDTLTNPNSKQRKRKETRCGCEARLYFKLVDGGMHSVYVFDENHNHQLASTFGKQFLMQNRHLSIDNQNFIMDLGHLRIGDTRAFHLVKEMVGGYTIIDMKAFVGGRDAEMVDTHLKNKRDTCKGYVFEYVADEEGTVTRLFLADSRSANDRKMFVDVVSFDATYSTNKYNLIFVPFTGVDNHKCYVTLASGLIANEDEDSYTWLLECFRKSIFHLPSVLVTDQDPTMKATIAKTFPESTHHFCMWHIAEKMKAKVPALDTQRKNRWMLDDESIKSSPSLKTELDIESHAANIFRRNIFKEFQNQIFAGVFKCYNEMMRCDDDIISYTIIDKDYNTAKYQVLCISSTKDARCSCRKFETTMLLLGESLHQSLLSSNFPGRISITDDAFHSVNKLARSHERMRISSASSVADCDYRFGLALEDCGFWNEDESARGEFAFW